MAEHPQDIQSDGGGREVFERLIEGLVEVFERKLDQIIESRPVDANRRDATPESVVGNDPGAGGDLETIRTDVDLIRSLLEQLIQQQANSGGP